MDLFGYEQDIYDRALAHIKNVNNGASCCLKEFEILAKEYGRLIKYVRKVTRFSDRTTVNLFESNRDLSFKVHRDALTGIYNRRFLEESLKIYIKDLSRSGSYLSLLILDIDFFKNFNDTYGHNAGDICLKQVASTLSDCTAREGDFVARYGGEEFVIMLPNTDEHGAQMAAKRIIEKIIEQNIPHEKSDVAKCVTISIGYTTIKVRHTHKGTDYISCADKALYMSKQNGRNKSTYMQFEEAEN